MKTVALFDTSISTLNKGDEIIMESAKKELNEITKDKFIITMPTHTPAFHWYQTNKYNSKANILNNIDFKFICGTNLLYTNMVRPWANWNINIFNSKPLRGSVLLGVGCGVNSKSINFYTRKLYESVLSKEYFHSVRDEKTKQILEKLGFKAINTGCPTTWSLTDELCKKIPKRKSNNVVFTLTDYSKDEISDQKLINVLNQNYETVYYWPQGFSDYEYFKRFKGIDGIKIIPPHVKDFSNLLRSNEIDYVGTRLHAGIFAMKHERRSIIITVDYRAREMNKSYNLNCLERESIDSLSDLINSEIETQVNIDYTKINKWVSQFN